jgi:hypothetical protein
LFDWLDKEWLWLILWFFPADSISASIQSSRQTSAAEMVCGHGREAEETYLTRPDQRGFATETQNVQLFGVERHENCLQEV